MTLLLLIKVFFSFGYIIARFALYLLWNKYFRLLVLLFSLNVNNHNLWKIYSRHKWRLCDCGSSHIYNNWTICMYIYIYICWCSCFWRPIYSSRCNVQEHGWSREAPSSSSKEQCWPLHLLPLQFWRLPGHSLCSLSQTILQRMWNSWNCRFHFWKCCCCLPELQSICSEANG